MQTNRPAIAGKNETGNEGESTLDSDASLMFKDDPEILADFVMETTEHLTAIDRQILVLEEDPSEMPIVHSIFRAFHSIKGLAGFLAWRRCRLLHTRWRRCSIMRATCGS